MVMVMAVHLQDCQMFHLARRTVSVEADSPSSAPGPDSHPRHRTRVILWLLPGPTGTTAKSDYRQTGQCLSLALARLWPATTGQPYTWTLSTGPQYRTLDCL